VILYTFFQIHIKNIFKNIQKNCIYSILKKFFYYWFKK